MKNKTTKKLVNHLYKHKINFIDTLTLVTIRIRIKEEKDY